MGQVYEIFQNKGHSIGIERSWFCQDSVLQAKSALDSTHPNAVFEFKRFAFRVAFSLNKGVVR